VRTSGAATEGLFVIGALGLLTLAGIWAMGGPYNFFQAGNRMILDAAEHVVLWVQAHR